MSWEAISAVAAAGAACAAVSAHVVTYAYQRGKTDHRLDAIEKRQENSADTDKLLSALTATVGALRDSVERLDGAVAEINRFIHGRKP